MANIRVTCPACKTVLEIDTKFEGEEIECGNCLEVFKAERPKKGDDPKIVVMVLPGAVPKKTNKKPPSRKKPRDDDDDDDDDYYPPSRPRRGSGPGDGPAVAALVLGIIGFVIACCWPISIGIGTAAVICGSLGLKAQNNSGMAVAGLVLGTITVAIALLLGFVVFGGFVFPEQFR